ncbi:lipoyl(octanoyl) transferase [Alicyclobacillus sacchari]|uniref:Octanoyltransferase n=1 Tax=Alicyclobacillus sacchari TaxID=392010 RepID=A0A4R8LL78_9BACL|nr:lipoyl(octanoyl) transferase LipB [Alicyclobacillus sacchari]TDY43429.1 lipoyl(octanoyl) transferase [Alicyclobacillus sacchari]GMA55817.1 octanoyltransferase [Alicyclobacillus sacchari]
MAVALDWQSLGEIEYDKALELQLSRVDTLLAGADERQTVYALEHPRTITIGRNGTRDHILLPAEVLERQGFVVREVDRGGDVTYHGPGQLVLYPILHLDPWGNDVSRFVRNLEEFVIRAIANVGITGTRVGDLPGVWVGDDKICAVGARVKRRPSGEFVTYHGIALNVNTQLSDFGAIVPCGIQDRGVTSIAQVLGEPQSLPVWEKVLCDAFCDVFDCTLTPSGMSHADA